MDLVKRVIVGCGGGVLQPTINPTIVQRAEHGRWLSQIGGVPALILGRGMRRCQWPRPSGLPGDVGMLAPHRSGGYVRTRPVVCRQFPFLRENGLAPHNRGLG